MSAPLIGISGAFAEVDSSLGRITWTGVSRAYVRAVERAGGIPVVLPVMDASSASQVVRRVDGLVVSGGGDVNPKLYGAEQDPHVYGVSDERDAFDYALIRQACERQLPLLAICRGMQMLNVVFGGTLIQHLDRGPHHLDVPSAYSASQSVDIATDTNLFSIVGASTLLVNSLHHQAVQTVGRSLVVSARAADGVVEGIEIDGRPTTIGVQWHPELLAEFDEHRRLFEWLVDAATDPPRRQ